MRQHHLSQPLRAAGVRALISGLAVALLASISGCATAPPTLPATGLLRDELFPPLALPIDATAVTALSPAMKAFTQKLSGSTSRSRDARTALLDAMHRPDQLLLRYDSASTRTAAEAFEARAGNCLSLVLMTAALAKELGLTVTYQSVFGKDSYTRSGDVVFVSGHVNIVLGQPAAKLLHLAHDSDRDLTVDFLPQVQLQGQRVAPIQEATVRAMFMNNRAAEVLSAGQPERSYWWAREAVLTDPTYLPGSNTLGVIYLRMGHLLAAEQALRHVLAQDPRQTSSLSNLIRVLTLAGRHSEAAEMTGRLAALQPDPPFKYLDQGRQAMSAGDYAKARELFTTELRKQPDQHEVHYWLAVAHQHLGDPRKAARHLALAAGNATTAVGQDLYLAKLTGLRQRNLSVANK